MAFKESIAKTCKHLGEDLEMSAGKKSPLRFILYLFHPGFQVCFFYRLARCFHWLHLNGLARFFTAMSRLVTGCDIHYLADLEGGVQFPHGRGVVIGARVRIARRCFIFHNSTLGATEGKDGAPVLEEGVNIYSGTVVAGPLTIGEYSRVGPNVYLTDSIASHTRVKPPEPILRNSDAQL